MLKDVFSMDNPYSDEARAAAYASVDFTNTYYLAFRDLPEIFSKYDMTGSALDFGCGTGRSTRFLREQGFSVTGVDVSSAMIRKARELDGKGDYRVIEPSKLGDFADEQFDLVISVMPFESMSTQNEKIETLQEIGRVLKSGGWKIVVATSRDIYVREWVSFSTSDYVENRTAKDGEKVRLILKDLGDGRVMEDFLWTEQSYIASFNKIPLKLIHINRPIVRSDDTYKCAWLSERTHAPWVVFVLRKH